MKKYNFTIVEELRKEITIDAENIDEARKLVKSEYLNGNIVLDYDDFDGMWRIEESEE